MRRGRLFPCLAALAAALPSTALGYGTTAAEFLRFGVGAPAGMSEAGGSVARDASALYWNPAGLAGLERPDAYFYHVGLPQTLTHDFLGAVLPVKEGPLAGSFGYSVQVLSQGSLDRLDNLGNPLGSFSASDMAHTLAYARAWGAWRAGASLRYIRQTIDNNSGGASALGLGVQRDFGAWSAGASLSNLGASLAIGSESFPLPLTLRAGASLTAIENELFLAGDVTAERGQGSRLHGGVEYRVYPPWEVYSSLRNVMVALRVGATVKSGDGDGPSGFAVGGSAELGSFRVDIGYEPFGTLGNSAQLGLGYRF